MHLSALLLFTSSWIISGLLLPPAYGEYIPPGPAYRCPPDARLLHPCVCDSESDVGITVRCANTNLATMSIGLNNLGTFQLPIEQLTIADCHIGRLYGSLLYKLHVRVLKIIDTPLEVIDEHVFLGTNSTLNELYVLNSSLTVFPKEAVQILGNLTILKIDGHRMTTLPQNAFGDGDITGTLTRLHITNGNLTAVGTDSLYALRKLRTLDLHGNQLKELKRNQFKGMREVEVLDISHNNIGKLEGSHIADLTKLGWCNATHNNLQEFSRGAFARNAVLKWLDMSHNHIKKLDSTTLRGMRFLRRLFISDNDIVDVGRGTFASVARIGTIDLARNKLKKIDFQMFYELNYMELIDVSANEVTEIQKHAFKDIFLTKINLSRNAITKIEVEAFVNCANITVLDLSYNNISTIPKRAFDENTYPLELQMSFNNVTDLSHIPLQNMTGIKILNVTNNKLEKIPRFTFPKLYELHTIDLSHNNLSDIYNSVFQVLFSLRSLNLSHNSLSSLKPGTFGPLPTVLELDLSYNGLKDMAKSTLTRLASMRELRMRGNRLSTLFLLPISTSHLDLAENEFTELPAKQWPSMNSLLSLDMSSNRLVSDGLVKGSLESLLTLQRLNLNDNMLTRPPFEALSDLPSLQYLYLEGNNLTELQRQAFGRIPVLFELHLGRNQLARIEGRAFEGLLQLLVLNLTDNSLSVLPSDVFQGTVALQKLDLSRNFIEKLDNKTNSLLEDCLSLEVLNLSHNRFSFLTRKTFASNPYFSYKLREIDLSHNVMPVITYDLVSGTSKLQKLNLSNNAIADIRRGVIGNLTSLKSLDLSNNLLEDVSYEDNLFNLPFNFSDLYISGNQLKTLPWSSLENVGSSLKVLDIRNNLFETVEDPLRKLIVNVTDVSMEGNPLRCDCFLRPLKRHFDSQLSVSSIYSAVQCQSPPYLEHQHLVGVAEERLTCPANVNTNLRLERAGNAQDYDVSGDLRYREAAIRKGKLSIKWLVSRGYEDIADTYLVIRDARAPQDLVFDSVLPYFRRSALVDVDGLMVNETDPGRYQLCLLAMDSQANVRNLYSAQCKSFNALLLGISSSCPTSLLAPYALVAGVVIATLAAAVGQ